MSVHPKDVETPLFWACGCSWPNYVQPRCKTQCSYCECYQANSRQAYCLEVLESPTKYRDEKRTSSPAYSEHGESTTRYDGKLGKGDVILSAMRWTRIKDRWHLCYPASITYVPLTDGEFVDLAMGIQSAYESLDDPEIDIAAIIIGGRIEQMGPENEMTQKFERWRDDMTKAGDPRELVLWNSELGVIDSKL